MKVPKSDMRCEVHPDFNPYDKTQFEAGVTFRQCIICSGLHYGVEPVGEHKGEYEIRQYEIENALIKIGPLNLAQFGHVRHSLGWNHHFSDGPSFYVDVDTMTVYCMKKLTMELLKGFKDRYKCLVFERAWRRVK